MTGAVAIFPTDRVNRCARFPAMLRGAPFLTDAAFFMAKLSLYFTNYIIILFAGFVKAKVLTDRGQLMGLAIPAARVTCGTIAVAPRKDTVARAMEALPGYWIFISFAHEDEALKNAPIQNHGSLKNWFAVLWRRA
jgi:hypothetical protein